jgi:gas vesicle protein
MGVAKKLLKFTTGSATGAAVGLVVGSLLAPQRGAELQQASHVLIGEARSDGQTAQDRTERELKERFRKHVNDPSALTDEKSSRKS